jgi:hypothetical protein
LEDFLFFSYTFLLMNRRSISDGSDRTEMAGARLELNGASKSRIIVTEPLPAQYHIASLVQKAPAPMALASQGVSENLNPLKGGRGPFSPPFFISCPYKKRAVLKI